MSDRTVAIIQARTGSTRLPQKVLKDILGRPMLLHVVDRTRVASTLDEVVVATSDRERDDDIAGLCRDHGISCYRGSESDVLQRYYEAAAEYDARVVVRVTSDCPLVSPAAVDRAVNAFHSGDYDFAATNFCLTYPIGLDVEVFSARALERAHREAESEHAREHVDPYLRDPEKFHLVNILNNIDLSRYDFPCPRSAPRWTVDHPSDIAFVREVYRRLWRNGQWLISQSAVLELLQRRPEIAQINMDAYKDELHLDTFDAKQLDQYVN